MTTVAKVRRVKKAAPAKTKAKAKVAPVKVAAKTKAKKEIGIPETSKGKVKRVATGKPSAILEETSNEDLRNKAASSLYYSDLLSDEDIISGANKTTTLITAVSRLFSPIITSEQLQTVRGKCYDISSMKTIKNLLKYLQATRVFLVDQIAGMVTVDQPNGYTGLTKGMDLVAIKEFMNKNKEPLFLKEMIEAQTHLKYSLSSTVDPLRFHNNSVIGSYEGTCSKAINQLCSSLLSMVYTKNMVDSGVGKSTNRGGLRTAVAEYLSKVDEFRDSNDRVLVFRLSTAACVIKTTKTLNNLMLLISKVSKEDKAGALFSQHWQDMVALASATATITKKDLRLYYSNIIPSNVNLNTSEITAAFKAPKVHAHLISIQNSNIEDLKELCTKFFQCGLILENLKKTKDVIFLIDPITVKETTSGISATALARTSLEATPGKRDLLGILGWNIIHQYRAEITPLLFRSLEPLTAMSSLSTSFGRRVEADTNKALSSLLRVSDFFNDLLGAGKNQVSLAGVDIETTKNEVDAILNQCLVDQVKAGSLETNSTKLEANVTTTIIGASPYTGMFISRGDRTAEAPDFLPDALMFLVVRDTTKLMIRTPMFIVASPGCLPAVIFPTSKKTINYLCSCYGMEQNDYLRKSGMFTTQIKDMTTNSFNFMMEKVCITLQNSRSGNMSHYKLTNPVFVDFNSFTGGEKKGVPSEHDQFVCFLLDIHYTESMDPQNASVSDRARYRAIGEETLFQWMTEIHPALNKNKPTS